MNITIAADAKVIEKARKKARAQGTSLQALLRKYLESLAGFASADQLADEYLKLVREHSGHSGGKPLSRRDAYEGRL